jgi:hypothetical protein
MKEIYDPEPNITELGTAEEIDRLFNSLLPPYWLWLWREEHNAWKKRQAKIIEWKKAREALDAHNKAREEFEARETQRLKAIRDAWPEWLKREARCSSARLSQATQGKARPNLTW